MCVCGVCVWCIEHDHEVVTVVDFYFILNALKPPPVPSPIPNLTSVFCW